MSKAKICAIRAVVSGLALRARRVVLLLIFSASTFASA